MLKGTTKIMARTVRRSIGQQRTVACEIGQQLLLLEQLRGVENSTKQLGAVSFKKEQQNNGQDSEGSYRTAQDCMTYNRTANMTTRTV